MSARFLKKHQIAFLPMLIKYDEEEQKKKLLIHETKTILGYLPTMKDFHAQPREEILRREDDFLANYKRYSQEATELDDDSYWVYAIDTTTLFVLDVDDPAVMPVVKPLLADHPYYLSTSKQLPKVFFHDPALSTNTLKNIKYLDKKLEVQKGQWSFLDVQARIHNEDKDIPTLDFQEFIRPHQPESPPPKKRVQLTIPLQREVSETLEVPLCFIQHHRAFKLCECLKDERWDNWDDWFRIGCALKSSKFSYSFHIWKYFSMKSQVFDEKKWKENGADKIKWDNIKIMDGGITMGSLNKWAQEDNPELYQEYFGKSYLAVRQRYEQQLFKINSPPSFGVLDVDQHLLILSEDKCKVRFRDVSYERVKEDKKTKVKEVEKASFIHTWLTDADKRCYEKIVFDPRPYPDPRMYNLFDGFAVTQTEYDPKAVATIHKYILEKLCGGDKAFMEFMLLWQAKIVQRPWDKTRVCIVIKSVQGIGKNLFTNFFGMKILGKKYYVSLEKMSSATGRFNGLLENKLFVNLNEVELRDTIDHQGLLKAYITDETIALERKNMDQITIANHMNFIGTTNTDSPFVIEHTDRRFACVESDAAPLTTEEITFYRDFFQDDKVAYSYYKSLMDMKLPEDLWLEKIRPETNYYRECKVIVAPTLLKFFANEMEQSSLLPKGDTYFCTYDLLYSRYKEYLVRYYNSDKKSMNISTFKVKLNSIPGIKKERKMVEGERTRGVEINKKELREYLQKLNLYDE